MNKITERNMQTLLKKNFTEKQQDFLEKKIERQINKLQKETHIDLNMPLKDFVIARR